MNTECFKFNHFMMHLSKKKTVRSLQECNCWTQPI